MLRLRRRPLYPTELRGHISHFHAQGAVLPLGAKALSCQVAGTGRQSGGGTPHTAAACAPAGRHAGRPHQNRFNCTVNPGFCQSSFPRPAHRTRAGRRGQPRPQRHGSGTAGKRPAPPCKPQRAGRRGRQSCAGAPLRRPAGSTRPAPLRGRECGSWPPTGPDCPNRD